MRRLIIGLTAALALVFVGTARADDTKSTESKSTTQKSEATKDTTKEANPYGQDTATGGSGSTKAEKKTTEKKETKTDEAKTPPPK